MADRDKTHVFSKWGTETLKFVFFFPRWRSDTKTLGFFKLGDKDHETYFFPRWRTETKTHVLFKMGDRDVKICFLFSKMADGDNDTCLFSRWRAETLKIVFFPRWRTETTTRVWSWRWRERSSAKPENAGRNGHWADNSQTFQLFTVFSKSATGSSLFVIPIMNFWKR